MKKLIKADSEWYGECHPLNDLGFFISDELFQWYQRLCEEMRDFEIALEKEKNNG